MYLVLTALYYFLYILQILLFIRVIMSWLPIDRNNPLVDFLHATTDPLLDPIRFLIQKSIFGGRTSMLDFSPIVAFLFLQFLQSFVASFI